MFLDLFNADACSIALGRKARASVTLADLINL